MFLLLYTGRWTSQYGIEYVNRFYSMLQDTKASVILQIKLTCQDAYDMMSGSMQG